MFILIKSVFSVSNRLSLQRKLHYIIYILCAFHRCGKTTNIARYKGATQVFIIYYNIIGILSYRFTDIVSLLFPFAKALLQKQT